jgi:DNA-binding transcriptional MerR regulator
MEWKIPGTVLKCPREEAASLQARFEGMFLGGDIALSQVVAITGLEAHTIQNWVKRGFLTPPKNKRYTLTQLCRILNIHALQGSMSLDKICALLGYVNGRLDDTSDDIIDDARLYFLFVRLAARARELDAPNRWGQAMAEALAGYEEPVPGARARVEKALQIMMTAWVAARMQQEAERLLQQAEMETNQEKEKK